MNARNAYVGQPMERVEDLRLLGGTGTFVDDMERPGMLHAAILRSPVAHARIERIDSSAALQLPGVHGVFTARNLPGPVPRIPIRIAPIEGAERFLQPVIAADRVRFVGEPIAVVVARSRAIAEDALEVLEVELDDIEPVADIRSAEADRVVLHEDAATNVVANYEVARGDPAAARDGALYRRTERFKVQRHTAVPMETRGLLADWDEADGKLTVWGAAKVPFFIRRHLAEMLGLAPGAVALVELDVGGGFGVRGEFYPEDFLIPFCARALGRAVKWIEDRREHFMATAHSRDVECELEIACTREGHIVALQGKVAADLGAYVTPTGPIVPSRTAQFLAGPYRIPNLAFTVSAVLTCKTPVGSYRGPGRFEANFCRERLMDMAAHDLGIDPVDFRRMNLLEERELPYPMGRLVPYEGEASYDTGDYHHAFERCLANLGWREKSSLQGRLIDGRYHGIGLGCFIDSSGAGPGEHARVLLQADGSIRVHVGSSALGQGIETTFTQIAADALGVPAERVEVRHGSTTLLDEGFGSYHSRSAIMGGNAIVEAANALLDAIRGAAATRLGCDASEVALLDEVARSPDDRQIPFGELAPLEASGHFASAAKPFSYGTHAAHVAVDPETGDVEILDYVAVEDAGRIINPAVVHGQKLGAIVQGLGGVLLEHLVYDDQAQLRTASFADYLLPSAADFQRIRAVVLELRPSPRNPLGVKGAGEDGIAAVAAAVSNAVAAALSSLDVQPNELPLSPPRIWALVQAARAAPGAAADQAASRASEAVAPSS